MAPIVPPSPRQRRLLLALSRGPVSREDVDRIAPAPNGPHYIATLRQAYGLALPCARIPCVTVDGDPSWRGIYQPTPEDRLRIAAILSTETPEVQA